ncbi:hypothetical protein RB653_004361 [Dictyostelium firmibasis]|uniref:Uncharacterized protein n=1 Tax=Dictyostelium firmibasis TaxID=79012 RepID=A0AAN7U7N5_9MYCE
MKNLLYRDGIQEKLLSKRDFMLDRPIFNFYPKIFQKKKLKIKKTILLI